MYELQIADGRYFVHEHKWTAWSWRLPAMRALCAREGVYLGKGNMCQHGMFIDTPSGPELALKATGWLANSTHILDCLAKLCTNSGNEGDHEHASLENSRAARIAVYPDKLCYAIFKCN